MTIVEHYFAGSARARTPDGDRLSPVYNPSTGEVARQVRLASVGDVAAAVAAAKEAQPAWAAMNPQRRARVLFKFKEPLPEIAFGIV